MSFSGFYANDLHRPRELVFLLFKHALADVLGVRQSTPGRPQAIVEYALFGSVSHEADGVRSDEAEIRENSE